MQNLWKFLNSRLFVGLLLVGSWPLLSAPAAFKVMEIGTEKAKTAIKSSMNSSVGGMKMVDPEERKREIWNKVEVLNQLQVSTPISTTSDWKGKEKYVAEISNNTSDVVNSIHYSASFYKDGKLVDVQTKWLGTKFILPNGKMAISIERKVGEMNDPEDVLKANMSDKVELSVVDFEIVEKPEEAK